MKKEDVLPKGGRPSKRRAVVLWSIDSIPRHFPEEMAEAKMNAEFYIYGF